MSDALYRLRQFFDALGAQEPAEADLSLARAYLPPAALRLFETMPAGDQQHSLAILRALLAQGYGDPPLLQAALLHDVAKARIGLWQRAAVILLNAVSPGVLGRMASADPRSWRYPFYLSLHHPELGANLAARTGLDTRAVELIRRHQAALRADSGGDPLTHWQRALKRVDDQN